MKRLNKYYTDSNLNQKLRYWYDLKQMINNSRMNSWIKRKAMRYCDQEINQCWRYAYRGARGYEINFNLPRPSTARIKGIIETLEIT